MNPAERLKKIKSFLEEKGTDAELKRAFWKPAGLLRRVVNQTLEANWLKTSDSLTQKLKRHFPDLEVTVLSEKMETPLLHEAQKLGISIHQEVWIRCVLLKSGSHELVYARTVIPYFDEQNPWQSLQMLGNKPLGEVLFQDKSLQRSGFEFSRSKLQDWPYLKPSFPFHSPIAFARRSVFEKNDAPLLLTEVFLPPLFHQHS